MRRGKLTAKRLLAAALVLLLCAALLPMSALAEDLTATTMRLEEVVGTVVLRSKSGQVKSYDKDKLPLRIYSGETVETCPASYAALSLDGSKAFKLDADSKARICSVRSGGVDKLEVQLISGKTFGDITEHVGSGQQLAVTTGNSICGVVGTVFSAEVVSPLVTILRVFRGAMDFTVQDVVSGDIVTDQITSGQAALGFTIPEGSKTTGSESTGSESTGSESAGGSGAGGSGAVDSDLNAQIVIIDMTNGDVVGNSGGDVNVKELIASGGSSGFGEQASDGAKSGKDGVAEGDVLKGADGFDQVNLFDSSIGGTFQEDLGGAFQGTSLESAREQLKADERIDQQLSEERSGWADEILKSVVGDARFSGSVDRTNTSVPNATIGDRLTDAPGSGSPTAGAISAWDFISDVNGSGAPGSTGTGAVDNGSESGSVVPIPNPGPEPIPASYTVTFNANGGTGTMQSMVVTGSTVVPDCGFKREGYRFTGWKDQNGMDYKVGNYLSAPGAGTVFDMTLYAQWEEAEESKYNIVVKPLGHGSATVNPIVAVKDEMVEVCIYGDVKDGVAYEVESVNAVTDNGSVGKRTEDYGFSNDDGGYIGLITFDMPAEDVYIEASFKPKYAVICEDSYYYTASWKAGVSSEPYVAEGETVTLSLTPAEGYEISGLLFQSGDSAVDVPYTAVSGGYSFTMPAYPVTVTAILPEKAGMFLLAASDRAYGLTATLSKGAQTLSVLKPDASGEVGEDFIVEPGDELTVSVSGLHEGWSWALNGVLWTADEPSVTYTAEIGGEGNTRTVKVPSLQENQKIKSFAILVDVEYPVTLSITGETEAVSVAFAGDESGAMKKNFWADSTVSFTVSTPETYTATVTAEDVTLSGPEVTDGGSAYSFTMPGFPVTVTVAVAEIQQETAEKYGYLTVNDSQQTVSVTVAKGSDVLATYPAPEGADPEEGFAVEPGDVLTLSLSTLPTGWSWSVKAGLWTASGVPEDGITAEVTGTGATRSITVPAVPTGDEMASFLISAVAEQDEPATWSMTVGSLSGGSIKAVAVNGVTLASSVTTLTASESDVITLLVQADDTHTAPATLTAAYGSTTQTLTVEDGIATLTMPAADVTVTATFTQQSSGGGDFTIRSEDNPENLKGTVTVKVNGAEADTASEGDTVTFVCVGGAGEETPYVLAALSVDVTNDTVDAPELTLTRRCYTEDAESGTITEITMEMPASNVEYSANFAPSEAVDLVVTTPESASPTETTVTASFLCYSDTWTESVIEPAFSWASGDAFWAASFPAVPGETFEMTLRCTVGDEELSVTSFEWDKYPDVQYSEEGTTVEAGNFTVAFGAAAPTATIAEHDGNASVFFWMDGEIAEGETTITPEDGVFSVWTCVEEGYRAVLTVTDDEGETLTPDSQYPDDWGNQIFTYTMGSSSVTVTAAVAELAAADTKYINFSDSKTPDGGKVMINGQQLTGSNAIALTVGSAFRISMQPDEGYSVNTPLLRRAGDTFVVVSLTKLEDGEWYAVMPETDVLLTASFNLDGAQTIMTPTAFANGMVFVKSDGKTVSGKEVSGGIEYAVLPGAAVTLEFKGYAAGYGLAKSTVREAETGEALELTYSWSVSADSRLVCATGFNMPETNLTMSYDEVTFQQDFRAITVEPAENGAVWISDINGLPLASPGSGEQQVAYARSGQTVTLTAEPAENSTLTSLYYLPEGSAAAVTITPKDGIYDFTMPESAVTVTAAFAPAGSGGGGSTAAMYYTFDAQNGALTVYNSAGEGRAALTSDPTASDGSPLVAYDSTTGANVYEASDVKSVSFVTGDMMMQPTSMARWFKNFTNLESVDLSGIDTMFTSSMSEMFYGCSSLVSVNNLSGVYPGDLSKMFYGCESLTELDLSGLPLSYSSNLSSMFAGCTLLKTIKVSADTSVSEEADGDQMFDGCTALIGGAGTAYDSNNTGKAYARIDGGMNAPGYFTEAGINIGG